MEHKLVKLFSLIFLVTGLAGLQAQSTKTSNFTDTRDGNVYKTVTIDKQVWMAENLRYMPSVTGPSTTSNYSSYYFIYGYTGTNVTEAKATKNYKTYGALYNWVAATKACPDGWHLPTKDEWVQLINYLGGEDVAGGKLKKNGTDFWESPNKGATNSTGFSALPGGKRDNTGVFYDIGIIGEWWTATEEVSNAWYWLMGCGSSGASKLNSAKSLGLSVRCVKD